MEKAAKIDPKKIVLNEAPPMENGVQNYLDYPSDSSAGGIYATQPNNWVFYSAWLPVKSLYGVNPNPAISIQLDAESDYQAMTKGMIAQIRKSPEIYVDFGFSKNHEDVAYLIWWTQ